MKKEAITEIISFLFIVLFVYAAVSKILDFEKFRVQLGQSPMLTAFAGFIAWIVPVTEIAISIFLAFFRTRLFGLYASLSLMTIFTAYIIAITRFSEFIPCSCGGVLQHMTWNQHLVFNIFFVLLAFLGIIIQGSVLEFKKTNKTLLLQ